MAVRGFTSLNRQVIKDLNSVGPVPSADGSTVNVVVTARSATADPRNKNTEEARYPGYTIVVLAPRPNNDWSVVQNTKWFRPREDDPAKNEALIAAPQRTFWCDFRVSVHANIQGQFDAMIAHMYQVWHKGRGQLAVVFPDDDDETILHKVQCRVVLLTNRQRPKSGVQLADYLVTCPISCILDTEVAMPIIEEVEFETSFLDTPDDIETTTATQEQLLFSVQAGNAQTAVAGTQLPVDIELLVTKADGTPVRNRRIEIQVSGGTVTQSTGLTDIAGVFTTKWTLPATAGANIMQALSTGATGSPVVITATGT